MIDRRFFVRVMTMPVAFHLVARAEYLSENGMPCSAQSRSCGDWTKTNAIRPGGLQAGGAGPQGPGGRGSADASRWRFRGSLLPEPAPKRAEVARECRTGRRCAGFLKAAQVRSTELVPGTEHHLIVNGQGFPLAMLLTGGNRNDGLSLRDGTDVSLARWPAVSTRRLFCRMRHLTSLTASRGR
ncbi:hypothetical protein GCM10010218_39180 [Streptomyces mashuensis]|uniref:Uncharacterized protein n=1 Tax=Streptomyces mashuensis TaxID=33904 RepID=A0A919B5T7_9ACTN|nr:hypothetical protein GCM10010218_39180 [Streptomyces mashuensis]